MQPKWFPRRFLPLLLLLLAGSVMSGCHPGKLVGRFDHPHQWGNNPAQVVTLAPTYTPTAAGEAVAQATATATVAPTETATTIAADTPTALPTATSTTAPTAAASQPTATATRQPAATRIRPTATPTPQPTPIVVIPNGFTKQVDSVRGYSLALPRGYTPLDLRSAQFRSLAGAVGMGDQLATLTDYLDSPAGQSVGLLAAADLPGMIFGGLPTIVQALVVNAPGASQETAQTSIESLLTGPGGFLSSPVITKMESATINNLPGVRATVTGNLAGANRPMTGKVVGLLANDKFYVLLQLTETGKWSAKEPIFDQIIGTFRPE